MAQFALGLEHIDERNRFGHGLRVHAGDHSARK
jgi:hypothetical protein